MSKALSVRIPESTDRQIQKLIEVTGMTQTQLVIVAIDRFFTQETKRETKQPSNEKAPIE